MARSSSEKAAEYDRRYPDSIQDYGQKVERMERIESRARRRSGYRGSFTVPELPWHKEK